MTEFTDPADITRLLIEIRQGRTDLHEQLIERVYAELKRTAQRLMRSEPEQTLQPTALVNEAYLRLFDHQRMTDAPSRAWFFASAAKAMRRILIEAARRRNAAMRGGAVKRQRLPEELLLASGRDFDLLALDESLTQLETLSPRQAEVVHLRWFAGLTVREISDCLRLSVSTVEQDWRLARAFLRRHLMGSETCIQRATAESADLTHKNQGGPGDHHPS